MTTVTMLIDGRDGSTVYPVGEAHLPDELAIQWAVLGICALPKVDEPAKAPEPPKVVTAKKVAKE
jgi:hypothetical protein